MPDVRMPDGTVVQNVPEGTTKSELQRRVGNAQQTESERGPIGDVAYSAGAGFLRGVSNILGLPADAANQIAQAAGVGEMLGASDDPVGGSQQIQRGIGALGGPQPGEQLPSEGVGRVGEEIGAASVPFGVVGGIARTGARGGMIGGPILQSFRQSPRANVAAEAGAATGAGVGAATAQAIAPESEGAEIAGQLIGGFASPLAATSRFVPGVAGARRALEPFSPGGARRQAAERVQAMSDDPDTAASRLQQPRAGVEGAELTPAQETQDPGLLRLERALMARDPEVEDRVRQAQEATRGAAEREAAGLAPDVPIERSREFFEGRLTRLNETIARRSEEALENAQRRAQRLGVAQARRGEASVVVRDEIEGALDDMQTQERALWTEVDEQAPVPTQSLKSSFQRIRANRRRADDPEDIPGFVSEYLSDGGRFGDTENIGELQTFRSRLLRASREERAKDAPNRRKLDILNELQSSALDDLGTAAGGEGDNLSVALNFSRELNERFRQGPVGRVLGYERRGGPQTAPEVTLERFLTQQGEQGGVNLQSLETAFQDSPERAQRFRTAAEDFVRARFAQQVVDDQDRVRPNLANRFIRNNRQLLEQFPDLRRELADAEGGQRAADRIARTGQQRQRNLVDRRKSRSALFLDAPVEQEVKRVLRSRDPESNMREIVRQARRDEEGQALAGIKHQFVQEMMDRATGSQPGQRAQEFLDNNRNVMRRTGLFDSDELNRIDRLVDTFGRLDQQGQRSRSVDELIDSRPDAMIDLASRVVGANIGAAGAAGSTGAPIVAAGAGSRFLRNITNRIPVARTRDVLSQAVLDRDLMRTLLQGANAPPRAQQGLERRLNAFLVNLVPEEQAQQQNQQQQP